MVERVWLRLGLLLAYSTVIADPASAEDAEKPARNARALASAPDAVPAAAPSADTSSSAEETLLNQGIQFRKLGDDLRALAAFEQAWVLRRSPRALAQLALVEQALDRWLAADEHLRQALQQTSDPWIQKHRPTLTAALSEIVSKLGNVEISCNLIGAEVRIDGVSVGVTPLAAPVRWVAGESVIQVAAGGYFALARRVQVDPGGLSRVSLTLTREPIRERNRPREAIMYGSLGLAALGVTVGVAGYWLREVNVRMYNDDARCARQSGVSRSRECPREASVWRTGEVVAIGGLSAGAILGALGFYLWWDRPALASEDLLSCTAGTWAVSCGGHF